MPIILPADFETSDPDDEWIAGLGEAPRCLVCATDVVAAGGVGVVGAEQTLVFYGPCAARVGAHLIADARELKIRVSLGQDGVRRVARLTRNVLCASEETDS